MSEPKPKVGRPVAADGDATRARILAVARTTFANLGYAATTFRLLAESTGLAPSAIYNYYGSKAELYAAVHDEVKHEVYTDWMLPAIAGTTTFIDRIDALLDSFVASLADGPVAPRFLATARVDTARHPELASIRDALAAQRSGLFADAVDLGIATGELHEADREELLAFLEAVTIGFIDMSSNPEAHRVAVNGFRRAVHAMLGERVGVAPTSR